MRQAKDALATLVDDMEQYGEALPSSVEDSLILEYDRALYHGPSPLLVTVDHIIGNRQSQASHEDSDI